MIFRFCVRIRLQLASSTAMKFFGVLIICLILLRVGFALGHGPDVYQVLPRLTFSKANCMLFWEC